MASFLSPLGERFDDLKTEMIISLELSRGEGCDLETTRKAASLLIDATDPILAASVDVAAGTEEFAAVFPEIERVYREWKSVSATMSGTLDMAYRNVIPRTNLLLDEVYAEMTARIGDPIAARYAELRGMWQNHVEARPWDAYMNVAPKHIDAEELEESMSALVRGDDLDVEDAIENLTGPLRHAFHEHLTANPGDMGIFEIGLWKRPEIIIANDYWKRGRRSRMIDLFREHGSKRFSEAMETLDRFFRASSTTAAAIVDDFKTIPENQRDRFARCLLLHPDHEVRRYAANNTDINSIWKAITPDSVPCGTVHSLLEHMVGSAEFSVGQQKIFFDTVYRRLMNVSTRSDVLYTRGIVRILTKMNFFMEDEYFAKLTALLEYLEAKEEIHQINDDTTASYMAHLRREKDKVGSVATHEPEFAGIPLVILRKLARDGHFWFLLSMHPIVKIARETVLHINSRDRAVRVATSHRVNQEVLRIIGKRRQLFTTLNAKIALVSNPRTPPAISLEYIADLTKRDTEELLRRSGIHPEIRTRLRQRYNQWKR